MTNHHPKSGGYPTFSRNRSILHEFRGGTVVLRHPVGEYERLLVEWIGVFVVLFFTSACGADTAPSQGRDAT